MTAESADTSSGGKYLRFFTELIFEEAYPDKNAYFGILGDFKFTCNYDRTATTNDESLVVQPKSVTKENVEGFANWNNDFQLDFHTSSAFNSIISAASLTMGQTAYFQVENLSSFGMDFPAEFYVKSCSVSDSSLRTAEKFFLV